MREFQFSSFQLLDWLPSSCIIKNLDLQYIGFNKKTLDIVKISDREKILGKSDFELPWKIYADKYKETDQLALKGESSFRIEPVLAIDGTKRLLLAKKAPIYSDNGKIIAIGGINFHLSQKQSRNLFSLLRLANINYFDFLESDFNEIFPYQDIIFTKRQAQIISALLKGQDNKTTARNMDLSTRTVEFYIRKIKYKLGYKDKNELINKAFDMGFIELLFSNIE